MGNVMLSVKLNFTPNLNMSVLGNVVISETKPCFLVFVDISVGATSLCFHLTYSHFLNSYVCSETEIRVSGCGDHSM